MRAEERGPDASFVVLQKLSDQIRACHERAAKARRKAEESADPAMKADYLAAESRWMVLARSYETTDRIADFTAAKSRKHAPLRAKRDDALLLQNISTSLIQEGDIDALYERILDAAIVIMSSDMGSMQILSAEDDLRLLAWRGFHPDSAAFWECVSFDSATTCGAALKSEQRLCVTDVEACDFMADTLDLAFCRLSRVRAVQSTPLKSRSGQLLGMISTHWCVPHQPPERALRLLDVLARQAADLIERTRASDALRESEERSRWLASIVESSDEAIISKNLQGVVISWNQGAERLFGYTADEAIGKPVTILIPPERRVEEPAILERLRNGERIESFETVRLCKDGRRIDVSLTVSPIRDASGQIIGASKIAHDITGRKRRDEQIATLAREAEHRTKNVLTTVQATVNLSNADTPDDLKRMIEGRIQALANVHKLFVESRWTGADLRKVVNEELAAYAQDGELRATVDGPSLLLEPDAAQALAVSLHELATNSAKYGALSVPTGHVHVQWSRGAGGALVLRWEESDGPSVEPPTRKGFGTRVLEGMIQAQLKGDINLDWRTEGLACEIVLPA